MKHFFLNKKNVWWVANVFLFLCNHNGTFGNRRWLIILLARKSKSTGEIKRSGLSLVQIFKQSRTKFTALITYYYYLFIYFIYVVPFSRTSTETWRFVHFLHAVSFLNNQCNHNNITFIYRSFPSLFRPLAFPHSSLETYLLTSLPLAEAKQLSREF